MKLRKRFRFTKGTGDGVLVNNVFEINFATLSVVEPEENPVTAAVFRIGQINTFCHGTPTLLY